MPSDHYIGPLFLTPGLVIAMHVTGQTFRPEQKIELRRYILNKRRPEGGWGLYVLYLFFDIAKLEFRHTAAPPTVYGTVMNYVALRLLGMGPDEGPMGEIRGLIHRMGELSSSTITFSQSGARWELEADLGL